MTSANPNPKPVAVAPNKQPPRPPPKAQKPKPSGIDTAHVSALYGQLNDFLTIAQGELTPGRSFGRYKVTKFTNRGNC